MTIETVRDNLRGTIRGKEMMLEVMKEQLEKQEKRDFWWTLARTAVYPVLALLLVAGLAFDPERDRNLRGLPAGHLFGTNVTHLAVKQGAYLRSFVYTFIELFSPTLNRKLVEQAMSGDHEAYEL